jgi:Na+-transporting methylmalonyl-CoA/oxaloacetate decarboxylase gamma subunit
MIDWSLVAKIAGGGFGVTILVLIIILLVAWLVGLVIQKFQTKDKESSS